MSKIVNLLWYDNGDFKEAEVDVTNVDTWKSLRREVAYVTSFVGTKLNRLRLQTRDGFDLEETFEEANFFAGAGILYKEILLIDPENLLPSQG